MFINIHVLLDSDIETEMNKIKDISRNYQTRKPNDTILEACFLKAKAYCFNTVKREVEKKLKSYNQSYY